MEYKLYNIIQGDTLESIAKKNKISIDEMLDFHNRNSGMMQQFFAEPIPVHISEIRIPLEQKKNEEDLIDYDLITKYRCEQTVVTKLNGIPTNTATTKREFQLKKIIKEDNLFIEIKILDNIIEMNPAQYQEAINLVSELDNIKCDGIILKVNNITGGIKKVNNHQEIIEKWKNHRNLLESKYGFIRDAKSKESIGKFIDTAGKQIENEKALIDDLKMKMFFEVIFNKYLVNATDKMDEYSRNVYSQLFEGEIVELKIKQDLLRESEDQILVRKVSSINEATKSSANLEEKYDEKFKPILKYKFSEYNASYRERVVYNDKINLPEEGEVTMIEEVKNNIQLLVNYNFRKIE
ncbi:hypothetical protein [Frigoriflavimonas asaccharolytica]|uniref:LysM domain-containing protein n=1 Tax=Frigoriflavimonas asaccharolytica TaxID=2735899 RepID=A0A8J8GA06_9FLAO|nr:hypothetical protein [Frigoriflavimonas asaccharolytica]NRS94119.1 hypothetical protein [Frigoriflavimonas asaccharolytica]